MWASSPLASMPSHSPPSPCLPKITIPSSAPTTINPVPICFFASAVTIKSHRPPPPPPQDKNTTSRSPSPKQVGGLGRLSVLSAVKSNPQTKVTKPLHNLPNTSNANPKQQQQQQQQQEEEEEGKPIGKEERKLSGSDVLLALQRSRAQKSKTKKRREYPSPSPSPPSSSPSTRKDAAAEVNYGDVRPICVKSEWITRLDELEKRLLVELMDEVQ